jgi:hypothetical protein
VKSKYHPKEAERFTKDIAEHGMTVLRDDGLYRHLIFRAPTHSWMHWFEIITWPGALVINGDMETFVFRRIEDMFAFFNHVEINPGYWAQKCVAGKTREYSEEAFKKHVNEYVSDFIKDGELDDALAEKLRASIEEDVFGDDRVTCNDGAHEVLAEFYSSDDFMDFEFTDTWEWDFRDWTYQYLWCCFAIVHAIRTYNASKEKKA